MPSSIPPSPYLEWCPPALTAAAGPLAESGHLLRALSDDSRGLASFFQGSPSRVVRDAVETFLHVYGDSVFVLAGKANSLATNLRWAAEDYVGTEQALHDKAMAMSPRTRS